MRSFGVRLPILAATAWAGIGFSAWAGSRLQRDHLSYTHGGDIRVAHVLCQPSDTY